MRVLIEARVGERLIVLYETLGRYITVGGTAELVTDYELSSAFEAFHKAVEVAVMLTRFPNARA
jgi:hypothetical protein